MKVTDLKPTDYYEYYELYLSAVPKDLDVIDAYILASREVVDFLESIPNDKWQHSYASSKWTVAEVIQHVIDTERIFIHRCFRIARGEQANISGFDQDAYVPTSGANDKTAAHLIEEYKNTRNFSISMLSSLRPNDFKRIGKASGHDLSAGAAAFIVLGHEAWHNQIIKDRYLM